MLGLSFVRYAIAASVLAGGVSAYLGVYVLLRRIVFVGIALAQIATLGVALGHLLGLPQLAASLAMSFLGVAFFALQSRSARVPREGVIGVAYAAASAFTILCVAKDPLGEMDALSLVFGNVLGVTAGQLVLLAAMAVAVALLHWAFHKDLLFTAFDPAMAESMGYRIQAWEFLFYFVLGAVFSLSVSIAGVLVIFAYLVIPSTAALVLDVGVSGSFLMSVLLAVLAGGGGVLLSYQLDLPTGPTIVATLTALLVLCAALARLRAATGWSEVPT